MRGTGLGEWRKKTANQVEMGTERSRRGRPRQGRKGTERERKEGTDRSVERRGAFNWRN